MHSTLSRTEVNFDSQGLFDKKQPTDTFGLEHGKYKDKSLPNSYNDPNYETSQTSKDDLGPGPGAYLPTMKAIYRSSPAYTFGTSHSRSRYHKSSSSPGPGAYDTGKNFCHKPQAPRYTFGQRYSCYRAPFIVEYKE